MTTNEANGDPRSPLGEPPWTSIDRLTSDLVDGLKLIDPSPRAMDSAREMMTWFCAIAMGTFLGVLLNFDKFLQNGQLPFKWGYLIALVCFAGAALGSALAVTAMRGRDLGIGLAEDMLAHGPVHLRSHRGSLSGIEMADWFRSNARSAYDLATGTPKLFSHARTLVRGSLGMYKVGVVALACYAIVFVVKYL